jgi:CHAT domain-containing protein
LIVTLSKLPDLQLISKSDFGYGHDRETITYVSEQGGRYAFCFIAKPGEAGGSYKYVVDGAATATGADLQRIAAERLLAEGLALSHDPGGIEGARGAITKWAKASEVWKGLGDKYWASWTLMHLGSAYSYLEKPQEALASYQEALLLKKAVGDKAGEATALFVIGGIYNDTGKHAEALESLNQALPLMKEIGDRRGEATVLNEIGLSYSQTGDHHQALKYYDQVLPLWVGLGEVSGEAITLSNMMHAWRQLNQPGLDAFYGKQSVKIHEQLRTAEVLDTYLKRMYLKSNAHTYRTLAEVLIAQGRFAEAHQIIELYKDQELFDTGGAQPPQAPQLNLTPREASFSSRYQKERERLEAVNKRLEALKGQVDDAPQSPEEAAQLRQLEGEVKDASDAFTETLRQAEAEFSQPSAEPDRADEIFNTTRLQEALKKLSAQTGQRAVAVYVVLDEENFSALLVKDDGLAGVSRPVDGRDLNKKALQMWALLQSDRYDPVPLAQDLYGSVFEPVEKLLPKDTSTILWSLDGNLRYLPVGALHDGKQYLVERYNHVVFTRADYERLTRPPSAVWTGTGLGVSMPHKVMVSGAELTFDALPGVRDELRTIFGGRGKGGGILNGEVLIDAQFERASMLAALRQRRPLVHIASHFSFRRGSEVGSFLLMGDGSTMTLSEMKQQQDLFAGVELLALSACNTAAQQSDADGREVDAFAEVAQRLGASAVLATLWPVVDNSTPWLMQKFYQTRQQGRGTTKAEALRTAQRALLDGTAQAKPSQTAPRGESGPVKVVITPGDGSREEGTRADFVYITKSKAPPFKRDASKPFAHPHYWAPFILIGNWL